MQDLGGDDFGRLLDDHCRLIRKAFDPHGGRVVSTEGDSFFAVFTSAPSALQAALDAQQALAGHGWPKQAVVKIRIGMHTGEGTFGGENYAGLDVHRAARIAAAGHGGQVLISATTRSLLEGHLPEEVGVKDLGQHRLKDLQAPEQIFQLLHPGLGAEFPMLRSLSARPNNLPLQLTSFVGRREEIDRVKEFMAASRLLTLSGPGGTGKTRLSLAAASEMLGDFADGVFFVPLAPITDPTLLHSTIGVALGIADGGRESIKQTLETNLQDKELLLVLDNFEQLVSGAPLLSEILTKAPGVKILVSSRAVLRLAGEQEYPVPPLALPNPDKLPSLEALTQYESVALFIQRGKSVKPGFNVTNQNAPAVAEICARLDGLPLAIELAAARLKVLTPQAILQRLASRLGLLTGGSSDLPARQQTLRNAIAWSYDLLDSSEQALFRRLSLFVGGWIFEDAETVCNPAAELGVDTIDALSSLVDKSLVRQDEDRHGDSRFIMLETIREFGLERFLEEESDADILRRRHAQSFMRLAEESAPNYFGPDNARWLNRMEDEHDNLRATLNWAREKDEAAVGLQTAAAMWRYWHLRGRLQEGRRWMDVLLALPSAAKRDLPRARGLNACGSLAYWQGDFATARRCYEESLALHREIDDLPGAGEALYNLAYVAAIEGDFDASRTFYKESEGIYRGLGNEGAVADAQFGVGMVEWLCNRYDAALTALEASHEKYLALQNKFGIANAVAMFGRLYLDNGDLTQAEAPIIHAIELFQEIGDLSGVASCVDDLALLLNGLGRHREAVVFGGAAQAIKVKIRGEAPKNLTKFRDPRIDAAKQLDEKELKAAWEEGMSLSSDETIARATARAFRS